MEKMNFKNYGKDLNEYQQQAKDFLKKTKTDIYKEFVGLSEPENWKSRRVNTYKVTLKNERGQYTFKFWDSVHATQNNTKPTQYDFLVCLSCYDYGEQGFKEFCDAYGYDIDSRTAEKVYKAVVKQEENLKRLFTEKELNLLNEVA